MTADEFIRFREYMALKQGLAKPRLSERETAELLGCDRGMVPQVDQARMPARHRLCLFRQSSTICSPGDHPRNPRKVTMINEEELSREIENGARQRGCQKRLAGQRHPARQCHPGG